MAELLRYVCVSGTKEKANDNQIGKTEEELRPIRVFQSNHYTLNDWIQMTKLYRSSQYRFLAIQF